MRIEYVKTALTATWMLTLAGVGYAAGTTVSGWVVLVALGVMPALMTRFWRRPAPTMSESIQEILR